MSIVLASDTTPPGARMSGRRHLRVDVLGRCFVEIGSGWEGSVLNLSISGMLLRLRRMMTPGSSYFVKILLGDTVAVVEARVVRIEPGGDEEDCLAGLEFLSMSNEDASILRGFVHR